MMAGVERDLAKLQVKRNSMPDSRKKGSSTSSRNKRSSHEVRSKKRGSDYLVDFESAKRVLHEVLRAEVESETVPSDVLSFRMKRSR